MKLVLLELEHFRQYRKASVSFADGLTGVIGPNGAGKTTLLEAIAFALFGSRAIRGKVEDVRQRGAPRAAQVLVRLVFEHEGQTFRIERSSSEAALYSGGDATPLATGAREVSAKLSSIVGMSHEEFFATYFTEQKGLEFLSGQKGAAERERFIIRLMGYDRFERIQELLRGERKEKRAELAGREASLGERGVLEAQLAQELEIVARLELELAEAAKALQQVEAQTNLSRKRFHESETRRAAFQKGQATCRELEARLGERVRLEESLSRERDEVEQRLKTAFSIAGIEDSGLVDVAVSDAQKQEALLLEQIRTVGQVLAEKESAWRAMRAEAEAAWKMVGQQRSELTERLTHLKSLEAQSDCPTCGQALGEAFEDVCQDQAHRLQAVEEAFFAARGRADGLKEEPEDLRNARTKVVVCEQSLALERQKKLRLSEVQLLRAEEGKLQNKLKDARAESHLLREQLEAQRKALEAVQYLEEIFTKDKAALETNQSLESVARLKRVRTEGDLGTKQALVERTKRELVDFDGKRREIEQRRESLLTIEETDVFLTDFRGYVNSSIRPRLSEIASELIADLTDGRYVAIEVEKDFAPTVLDDGERKPVISGGEEDILNLCMRLALSQMLAERAGHSFSLLVLDEVFGSLDEQRRANVLQLLEKLSNRFEQILIITHLEDIKEGVRHVCYVDYDEASGEASLRPL